MAIQPPVIKILSFKILSHSYRWVCLSVVAESLLPNPIVEWSSSTQYKQVTRFIATELSAATIDNVIEEKLIPVAKKPVDCIRLFHLIRKGISEWNVDVVVIKFDEVL